MILSSKYRRIRNNRARISGLQLCFSAPRISLSSPRALNTETYKALNHKPLSLSEMKEDANRQFFLSLTQSRSQSLRYYIQANISAPETTQSPIPYFTCKESSQCLSSVSVRCGLGREIYLPSSPQWHRAEVKSTCCSADCRCRLLRTSVVFWSSFVILKHCR